MNAIEHKNLLDDVNKHENKHKQKQNPVYWTPDGIQRPYRYNFLTSKPNPRSQEAKYEDNIKDRTRLSAVGGDEEGDGEKESWRKSGGDASSSGLMKDQGDSW